MDTELQKRINSAARFLLRAGHSVIPIADSPELPPEKRKKPAIEWMRYYSEPMPEQQWDYPGCNVALVTGEVSGVVVVDCDSDDAVKGWCSTKPLTPLRVRSRRGMHFYYRHPGEYVKSASRIEDSAGFKYDVKGDKSCTLAPPSLRSGHQYQVVPCTGNILGRWVLPADLPVFDMAWRPETKSPDRTWNDDDPKIRDGIAYIRKIFAVEGQGGDKATYQAACTLIESGMSEASALAALMEWNQTNANPPWQPRDLLRKVQCAISSPAAS